ncbi:MAG: hypothetical protein H6Q31_1411 [Bacteroidetes bacterium]|jgi:nitrogen-specific signal transduction histidine kinase|nr:hypothetical protein [Bacteroidota bacterium]
MPDSPRRIEDLDHESLVRYTEALHSSIRQIAHDISSPLGILRMALYFLQNTNPEESKRGEYYTTISQAIDRMEQDIHRLRTCAEFSAQPVKAEGEKP